MTDHAESGKWRGIKKCMVLVGLVICLGLSADAEPKGSFTFGIQAGWAIGLKPGFEINRITMDDLQYITYGKRLHQHMGGYMQYNISDQFGLQFSLSYQNGSYTDGHFNHQTGKWYTETAADSFFSYSLNVVYNFPERKNLGFYLLGGVGLGHGDNFVYYDGSFFIFSGGTGVKIRLGRKDGPALNLGASFHHLLDPSKGTRDSTEKADLIRLTIGLEFTTRTRRVPAGY